MPVDLSHVYLRDRVRVDCAWSLRGVVKMVRLAVVSEERAQLLHWTAEAVDAKRVVCFVAFRCARNVCVTSFAQTGPTPRSC